MYSCPTAGLPGIAPLPLPQGGQRSRCLPASGVVRDALDCGESADHTYEIFSGIVACASCDPSYRSCRRLAGVANPSLSIRALTGRHRLCHHGRRSPCDAPDVFVAAAGPIIAGGVRAQLLTVLAR